jgi:hypothetical protein
MKLTPIHCYIKNKKARCRAVNSVLLLTKNRGGIFVTDAYKH